MKQRGLYYVRLADDIDPERKNADVPNTVQRVLRMGADSELVGRTLLTGQALLKREFLPDEVDCDKAMGLVLGIVRDLVAMSCSAAEFQAEEVEILAASDVSRRKDGSVILPDLGEVEGLCRAFLQRAGHVQRELLELVKVFYPGQNFRRWFDSFKEFIEATADEDDEFVRFIEDCLPTLRFVRNARNCVEHPKENEFVEVVDFSIDADAALVMPTIEVRHPEIHFERIEVSTFKKQITEALASIVEEMLVSLCGRHVQPFGGMDMFVIEVPKERRRNEHVRFGYGTCVGERMLPVG